MVQTDTLPQSNIPSRLLKLMLRLAQAMQPGMAYTITVFVLDGDADPVHTVTPLGKIENYRQKQDNMIR